LEGSRTKTMNAVTKSGKTRRAKTTPEPARRFRLPGARVIAAAVGAILLAAGGYFAWQWYFNSAVDYAAKLKVSPALKNYQAGLVAAQGGRQKEAEEAFQRAIDQDPYNALIYNALATFYINAQQVPKAIVTAENGVVKAPGSPDLYYTLGLARYQAGRFDEAAQALERAVDLRPKYPEASLWLGNTYLLQASVNGQEGAADPVKLQAAVDQFRRAIALDPDTADYHAALAEALFQRRELAEARTELERATAIDPGEAKYAYSLGKVCEQLDDLDAAEAAFKHATERDAKSAEAFYGLGATYFKRQRDEEAIAAFRSALKLNQFYADAQEKLGQALVRSGQQEEGQKQLLMAEESRKRAQVIDGLRRASAMDPSNAKMANDLGIELARQGDFPGAMTAFQRALAADPKMIDAHYQMAGVYMQNGNIMKALEEFSTVDKAQPGYRWTNYWLSKLNEKVGRKPEAERRLKLFEQQKAAGTLSAN
jgi:superkiller protein 3